MIADYYSVFESVWFIYDNTFILFLLGDLGSIVMSSFVPTCQDILRILVPTTGITECLFYLKILHLGKMTCQMIQDTIVKVTAATFLL